jgi:hypothetical protein
MSKTVERQDEHGVGTGIYDTLTELNELDEDENPVVVRLSPEKAVQRMKSLPEFLGFFRANAASGIGGNGNQQPTRNVDPSKLTTEQYMELRRTNPRKLGIRR